MELLRKKATLISFTILTLIMLSNKKVNCTEYLDYDLDSNRYYIDEICSYNYEFYKTTGDKSEVTCNCKQGFKTYGNLTFGNYKIQCNYEQKRRFIVFFFSIFLLFGFEYLYLERYFNFVLILCYILFVLISSCYCSIISRDKKENEDKPKKINFVIRILPYTILIWWILNNILIITGKVTDGNGQLTYNDISYMILN